MTNPQPSADRVDPQYSWRCFNLDCTMYNSNNIDSCFSCGNKRGYMSPEIESLIQTSIEEFVTSIKTELPNKSIKGFYTQHMPDGSVEHITGNFVSVADVAHLLQQRGVK